MKVETLGRGVILPELRLALDTSRSGYESLVSHAHGDHIPWEARHAWASVETTDLLSLRKPDLRVSVIPWREPTRIGAARVTLHPAGHILGSALVHVEAPDGETFLYTGDTKTEPGGTCAPAEYPQADTLLTESTFGLPIYRWPSRERLADQMAAFARATLAEGAVPVFTGYALGKAQEILALLTERGVPTIAHGAVWNMCDVYRRHGIGFPTTRAYAPGHVGGAALVVPPSFREHPMVTKLDVRLAYVSGWARLSRSRIQNDADCLVPLSDHADFPGLLEIVERVRPKRVLANHGYADVFTHILRKRGHDAQPLQVGHLEEDAAGAPAGAFAQEGVA